MKRFAFILFLTLPFCGSYAQDNPYSAPKLKEVIITPRGGDAINHIMPDAKYLFKNEKGNVYRLPLDNMLCLAPKIDSDMPVYDRKIIPKVYKQPGIIIPLIKRDKDKDE